MQDVAQEGGESTARIIELEQFGTIYHGNTVIVHDRRASSNRALNAPWMWETMGGDFQQAQGISFADNIYGEDVSIWVRVFSERADAKGWEIAVNGEVRTVIPSAPNHYEWVQVAQGTYAGQVSFTLKPLGARSRVDALGITSTDSDALNGLLSMPPVPPVPDAQIHVAMNGSDGNEGTELEPLLTLQEAVDRSQPGDTVLVREGTYSGFHIRKKSGLSDAWITLLAHPGERVVIDVHRTESKVAAIQVTNPSQYWILDGFEVTDTNPVLDELRALDVRSPVDKAIYDSRNSTIDQRWGLRFYSATSDEASSDIVVRNMEFHNLHGTAVSGSGHRFEFFDNHVHNIGYPRSGYGWYSGGQNHVYRNNIVHDAVRALQANSSSYPQRLLMFEQNLIYRTGIYHWIHASSGNTLKHYAWAIAFVDSADRENTIRNNIFIYNGLAMTVQQDEAILHNAIIDQQSTSHAVRIKDGTQVINNVFGNTKNTIDAQGSGHTIAGNYEGDLKSYEDVGMLNFTLIENSPLIGAGVPVTGISLDFTGASRSPASWDVGPISYKGLVLP